MNVGGSLRSWRERLGIRAADLARALNLNTSTLARYELGRRDVPYELLEPWGRALGLRVELRFELLSQVEDPSVAALREVVHELQPHERQLVDGLVSLARARQAAASTLGETTAMSTPRR